MPIDTPRSAVVQLVDSLAAGGAERVAVNLSNALADRGYHSMLCSLRGSGPLEKHVSKKVEHVQVRRSGRFDFASLGRLRRAIGATAVVHSHGSAAIFVAAALAPLKKTRRPRQIIHLHDPTTPQSRTMSLAYQVASVRADQLLSVSDEIERWVRTWSVRCRAPIQTLENFVEAPEPHAPPSLPGHPTKRIVCVANFRAQKDHETLLAAMYLVLRKVPEAQLILVGAPVSPALEQRARALTETLGLRQHVHFFGPRADVPAILSGCTVGVLSSKAEGMPLTLLEYGNAGLGVVATNVGECHRVLEHGRAGWVVPPQAPGHLAAAIVEALTNAEARHSRTMLLQQKIARVHSLEAVLTKLETLYATLGVARPVNHHQPKEAA